MMHKKNYKLAGKAMDEADKALIMIHGRGANADDILSLGNYLDIEDYAIIAPEATNKTWYPYSFLAPPVQNEPWLSSALQIINEIVASLHLNKFTDDKIFFAGFSQGACLTLEYMARNAKRYGGAVAFTGGLIGDKIYSENYKGEFEGMPVFIGTSDPDMHVPVKRVEESAVILKNMKANVKTKIYTNMGHTINEDEIATANEFVFNASNN